MLRFSLPLAALSLLSACGSAATTPASPTDAASDDAAQDAAQADATVAEIARTDASAAAADVAGVVTHPTTGKSWTILVYMVADNDLEPSAIEDLKEMLQVGSAENFNLVVLCDRAVGMDERPVGGLKAWTTAKLLQVDKGALTEIEDLGELNLGDPKVLRDFIVSGVQKFPADRYALIFWDHGDGAEGFGDDESTETGDTLTLPELSQGIGEGLKKAGVAQLAIVGFDACLMAGMEAAAMAKPYAEYLLASEELEPGFGWDYKSLALARNDPTVSPVALGSKIVADYKTAANFFQQGQSITLSLVDLPALDAVFAAWQQLATQLASNLKATAGAVGRQRIAALEFGKAPDASQAINAIDVQDWIAGLKGDAAFLATTKALTDALTTAVVAQCHGAATAHAHGISVYFPLQENYYYPAYDALTGVDAWRNFLKAWFSTASAVAPGPKFQNQDKLAQTAWQTDTLAISGALLAGVAVDLIDARGHFGEQNSDGTAAVRVDLPGNFDQALAQATWNGLVPSLTSGTKTRPAAMKLDWQDNNGQKLVIMDIPMNYQVDGQTDSYIVLRRVIEAVSGQQLSQGLFEFTEFGIAAFYPDADGLAIPIALTYDVNGIGKWLPLADTGLSAQGLQVSLAKLPVNAQIYAEIEVTDIGGQTDAVVAKLKLP